MNRLLNNSVIVALLALSGTALGVDRVVEQNFDRPQLDRWVCVTEQHGFQMHIVDGLAMFSKIPGLEDGLVRLNGTYEIEGDFVARVLAHRSDLNSTGEMGLVGYFRSGEFVDIFFNGNTFINANMFQTCDGGSEFVANSDPTVEFTIRRVGQTVSLSYSTGDGDTLLHEHSGPCLATPIKLGLFLVSEYRTPEPLSGWFDNWVVSAGTINQQGCIADLDNGTFQGRRDCGVTIDDLIYFLNCYGQGLPDADMDDGSLTGTLDGGVTIEDLLYYLDHYYAGC